MIQVPGHSVIEKIGSGAYGSVYRTVSHENIFYAIKTHKITTHVIHQHTLCELNALTVLSHPGIVRLHDIQVRDDTIYSHMDYVKSNLSTYIHRCYIRDTDIKGILIQLLDVIAYCHHNHFAHRDLKPDNILITSTNNLRLCDFGTCKREDSMDSMVGISCTYCYASPEVLRLESYDGIALDMWSIGCIFAEMLTRRVLYLDDNPDTVLDLIKSTNIDSTTFPMLCEDGLDLLQSFLTQDSTKRITAVEALYHPYFKGFDKPQRFYGIRPYRDKIPCPNYSEIVDDIFEIGRRFKVRLSVIFLGIELLGYLQNPCPKACISLAQKYSDGSILEGCQDREIETLQELGFRVWHTTVYDCYEESTKIDINQVIFLMFLCMRDHRCCVMKPEDLYALISETLTPGCVPSPSIENILTIHRESRIFRFFYE